MTMTMKRQTTVAMTVESKSGTEGDGTSTSRFKPTEARAIYGQSFLM